MCLTNQSQTLGRFLLLLTFLKLLPLSAIPISWTSLFRFCFVQWIQSFHSDKSNKSLYLSPARCSARIHSLFSLLYQRSPCICTNQQPSQRGCAIPGPAWVESKWLLNFPKVPVTPGTLLHFLLCCPLNNRSRAADSFHKIGHLFFLFPSALLLLFFVSSFFFFS